jgi:3-dehydroquinate synthase
MMQENVPGDAAERGKIVVRVDLEGRGYDIDIGGELLADSAAAIERSLPGARFAVVSDANVAPLYLDALKSALSSRGRYLGEIVVPAGEASKSFPVLARVCEDLLKLGVERGDAVIALGGGVVGDLAGFAAGILRRGVRYVQVPTSLLAQVDSSVGGKTGIDTPQGKNLIGAFHQPSLVIVDPAVLATLPPREFRAGYAEVMKYGLLGDAAFFAWLEREWPKIFASDPHALLQAIATSCRAKAAIVAADEREESGKRALLNLGHTFGHALEAFAGYSDRLLHGEAIAIGMRLAFTFSVEKGLCPGDDAKRVERHLLDVGLPSKIAEIPGGQPNPEQLLELMRQDKKVKGGKLALVLVRGIGEAFVQPDVSPEALRDFLNGECKP